MRKLMRVICAIMAGAVALLLGHDAYAETEAACSPADYRAYQDALISPSIEGAPHELLEISEGFLHDCPARPEAPRVALAAARQALDSGDAGRALEHFQTALEGGVYFPHQSRMDYITANLANDNDALAWQLRDAEITHWFEELTETGMARIEQIRLRDGLVYRMEFDAVDPGRRVHLAWMAVPFGPGFPVTITSQSEAQLIALLSLRAGPAAESLEQLVLNRCRGRETLYSTLNGLDESDAERRAMEVIKIYLANPDRLEARPAGLPMATCFATDRVFIVPDPVTAVPAY